MSQQVDTNTKTFTAGAAIAQFALVQMESDGDVITNVLATWPIGVAQEAAFADGDPVTVKLLSAAGTHKMIATQAIAAGAPVFTAAAGKVDLTAGGAQRLGIALEASTANADVIEVVYIGSVDV